MKLGLFMASLSAMEGALTVLNLLFTGWVVFRFWRLGLFRRYIYFCSFLIFVILRGSALLALRNNRSLYGYAWACTEVAMLIILTLVTLEIHGAELEKYPGIRTLGRRMLWLAMGCGFAFGIAGLQQSSHAPSSPKDLLPILFLLDRTVLSSLGVVILIMSALMMWFPLRLPRNTLVHSYIFAVYFLSKAFLFFMRPLVGREYHAAMSCSLLLLALLCLTAWIVLMRREAEDAELTASSHWTPNEEARLLRQLKGINAALGRTAG